MVMPKGYSKTVSRKKADNTMLKSKWAKRQTRIYTKHYRQQKIEQHIPHLKTGVNICAPKG